jgi:hypothetical protein
MVNLAFPAVSCDFEQLSLARWGSDEQLIFFIGISLNSNIFFMHSNFNS